MRTTSRPATPVPNTITLSATTTSRKERVDRSESESESESDSDLDANQLYHDLQSTRTRLKRNEELTRKISLEKVELI